MEQNKKMSNQEHVVAMCGMFEYTKLNWSPDFIPNHACQIGR